MDFFKKPSPLVSYIMIIIGTGIMGISLQNFYDPIGLVTGGFTGLAIVIKTATAGIIHGGIPLWFTNLAINIPVFLAQHATATCCRECIRKWHKMQPGKELSQVQQDYLVDVIMTWIKRDLERNKNKL